MSNLYLVSTPIGNLEDISLRALKVLAEVPVIACEDTRKTGLLLAHFNIKKTQELTSFFEGNEQIKVPYILNKLLNGTDVALVTNAGTPAISDPGFKLVRACREAKLKVVSIPGPSASLAALTVSGLPTDKFLFLGFLPKKPTHRKRFLAENIKFRLTTIVYLSPYRIVEELTDLREATDDIEAVLCRELTKVYEETRSATLSELILRFKEEKPKGEFTLIFHLPLAQ